MVDRDGRRAREDARERHLETRRVVLVEDGDAVVPPQALADQGVRGLPDARGPLTPRPAAVQIPQRELVGPLALPSLDRLEKTLGGGDRSRDQFLSSAGERGGARQLTLGIVARVRSTGLWMTPRRRRARCR